MEIIPKHTLLLASIVAAILLPISALAIVDVNGLKSSPYCSTTPPQGINPEFYKWPKEYTDAYHGTAAEKYYSKRMFFCRGHVPEIQDLFRVWPTWELTIPREDWDYPITFVDTAAGVLTVRGTELAHEILLDGKIFLNRFHSATIDQAFPEEKGKPQMVIVSIDNPAESPDQMLALGGRHLIDFGVTPPFVSFGGELNLGTYETVFFSLNDVFSPPESYIKRTKIDEDTYEFSGPHLEKGKISHVTYRYNRKLRTLEKIER